MLNVIIKKILGPYFKFSSIGLRLPDQSLAISPGDGSPTVYFKRWRDTFHILLSPDAVFTECYVNSHIEIENGSIFDLVMKTSGNDFTYPKLTKLFEKLSRPFLYFHQGLNLKKSKENVVAHYDLGNDFYRTFVDQDMQYSSGYYRDRDDDLVRAQQQKKDHVIKKLIPEKGLTVLDIGCGWGGLSLEMARCGLVVTGITLSEEQFSLVQKRCRESGYNIKFKLQDYRLEKGNYDRIVSVEMLEHVGKAQIQEYFDQIALNLKDDGIALIHTMGHPKPPQSANRFITKYISPGIYIPSLSQIISAAEKSGLLITDVECLYLHYDKTLRQWQDNFTENRDAALAMYDERFVRIWEIYLAGCEAGFKTKEYVVFQVQLRKKQSQVNLTRDYLYRQY